jgi:Ni/Co efflux regulator RcnB
MRKLIILGLMAAVAAPTAATAQSRGEIRRDRQELREEQRELRQARRFGDRRDVRHERRDVRAARQELREDRADRRAWRRDDWRSYRTVNRSLYSRGHWGAPFAYRSFRPGFSISAGFFSPRYVISNPWHYRLPAAHGYQRWVRHYDDLLLVDIRRGIVVDVIRNFYW